MEDSSAAEFQDFPNGQTDMYFESWDFSSEWLSELKAFKFYQLENTVK